jgi:hypothetical protein
VGVPIGPAAQAVFAKALALDPAARFPDIGTFWNMLQEAAGIDGADDASAVAARKTLRMRSPIVSAPPPPPVPSAPPPNPFANIADVRSTARMGPSKPPPPVPTRPPAPAAAVSSPPRAPPPAAPPMPQAPSVMVKKTPPPQAPPPPSAMAMGPTPAAPFVPGPPRPQVKTLPPEGGRTKEEITANRRRELVAAGPSMGTKVLVGVLVFVAVLVLGTLGILVMQRGH